MTMMMTRFIRRWNGKSSTSDNSPSFAVGADPSPAEDNSGGWWCKRQEGGVWAAFFLLLLFQPVYRLKQLLRSPRTTQILKHHHKQNIYYTILDNSYFRLSLLPLKCCHLRPNFMLIKYIWGFSWAHVVLCVLVTALRFVVYLSLPWHLLRIARYKWQKTT